MSADQVHLERRASQRFDFQLPVVVRLAGIDREGYGFTQDLSGRGVFFYTDFELAEGDAVELTLVMPSEITLTENMRVRCRGQVRRVMRIQSKFGVAVHLQGYEYLPKAETATQVSANFPPISAPRSGDQAQKTPPIPGSRSAAAAGSETAPWAMAEAAGRGFCGQRSFPKEIFGSFWPCPAGRGFCALLLLPNTADFA